MIISPEKLSGLLQKISSYIESESKPDLGFVRSNLASTLYITAASQDFALDIREACFKEIQKALPGEFSGDLFDTHLEGKGFADGYVSFALKPQSWISADILGGILISAEYSLNEYKSSSPKRTDPARKQHKGDSTAVTLELSAGYYNKKLDGGIDEDSILNLGQAIALVDENDDVVEFELDNINLVKKQLSELIQSIIKEPPAVAKSNKLKKFSPGSPSPTTSIADFLKWAENNNPTQSEVRSLAQAIADRSGKTVQDVEKAVIMKLRAAGFSLS